MWHKLAQGKQLQSQVEGMLLFVFSLKLNTPKHNVRVGKSHGRSSDNNRNLLSTLEQLYFKSCLILIIKYRHNGIHLEEILPLTLKALRNLM